MRYWLLWSCWMALPFALKSQTDSVRVIIHLNPANDQIELSYGYEQARAGLNLMVNMYNLQRGVKTLAKQYRMTYDNYEDAWVLTLAKGFYELRIESLGFTDIIFPMRLKKDLRQEFNLEVDSTSYTYENRKRYNYIMGTKHFIQEALAEDGFENINVLRIQKMRNTNAFLVNLEIIKPVPLNLILYRKVTEQPPIEPGLIMGKAVTRAIERLQANPTVLYANPTFVELSSKDPLPSAEMAKSARLERKLLRLMEDDPRTLDRINYIIQKTTPPKAPDPSEE